MADDTTDTAVRTDGPYARPGNTDAWRIAALEREIQELRRTNEELRVYVSRELDPEPEFTVVADQELAEFDVVPGRGTGAATPAATMAPATTAMTEPAHPRALAEFHALGPIEAFVGGRLVDLGAPKQRALLALLVGKVGRPVAVDTIVEELWAGQPPPSAVPSLQAYVANLRRVLEPDRAPRTPPTILRTYGRGYLLDTRVVEVDVQWFGERSVAGWQALDRGDARSAVHEFESALALWRGQAYAEVADTAYIRPDVARLEELRLSVVEGRCAALLAVGAHEIAVAELEAFVQDHPLREYGCELLGLALYRAGRQADALAVLRTNQRRLADELGIDPRPALRRLEQQILTQSASLDWHPAPRPPAVATRRPPEAADRRPVRRPPAHRDRLPRPDFFRSSLLAER
ncbi:transcriptional regulator [Streptomyces sp. Act143]|uniref:AfsR/SARP family transcriptional regulator n=1 Tax=Streptomyces sp. Act143 TaxID=2200760 RepID=UPI000D674A53|nr:AfsR/SARP family transcriptional regulator [Streptomyces sp. Act143]PWI19299.1 transcriptional regulator [Streptomyces sp. Act143]